MQEFCKKCGCGTFIYKTVYPHVGKYCAHCGAWQKWVPKNEINFKCNCVEEPITENVIAIDDILDEEVPW